MDTEGKPTINVYKRLGTAVRTVVNKDAPTAGNKRQTEELQGDGGGKKIKVENAICDFYAFKTVEEEDAYILRSIRIQQEIAKPKNSNLLRAAGLGVRELCIGALFAPETTITKLETVAGVARCTFQMQVGVAIENVEPVVLDVPVCSSMLTADVDLPLDLSLPLKLTTSRVPDRPTVDEHFEATNAGSDESENDDEDIDFVPELNDDAEVPNRGEGADIGGEPTIPAEVVKIFEDAKVLRPSRFMRTKNFNAEQWANFWLTQPDPYLAHYGAREYYVIYSCK